MPAGRPLKFKSAKDLQQKIDDYFAYAEANGKPYSIAAMAVYLDCSRECLYHYANEKEEYSDLVKRAISKCMAQLEERLLDGKQNVTGGIFIAKNYGYTDKQEIDQNIGNKDDKPFEIKITVVE